MTTPFDEQPEPTRKKRGLFSSFRASFLTGLVVIAPIALTLWLIWTVAGWVDSWVLPFVPLWLRPDQYVGLNIRGVGVFVFLIFTVLVGWMAKGLIGRSLLSWAEGLVQGLPVVRSIYNGLKQIAETVFAQSETSFDKACLVEYPRKGIWAIAFISTSAKGEIESKIEGDDGKKDHCVAVWANEVFDSNLDRSMRLTREALDLCCSTDEVSSKFVRFVKKAIVIGFKK